MAARSSLGNAVGMDDDIHLQPYLGVVDRVAALAHSTDDLGVELTACPGWTARDVIAHLAGLAQDWVDGNLDGYGSDEWTSAQVARFSGASVDEVLHAWGTAAGRFPNLASSPIGGTAAMWAFGDAVVHEADLLGTLAPGTQVPEEPMALGLKAAIARWRHELGAAGVEPLDVVATDMRTWRVGDHEAPANTVTTTAYELFRALYGRRSRAQVEQWAWNTDSAGYLDVPLPYPFRWATSDIED